MGKPKTDSGEQKNPSNSGSASKQSAMSGSSPRQNPAKLPPAGFIYSDDENLMDELSMGWGLTTSDEQDELDAIINKTVDMGKVSSTKLKALAEPPKSGVERIERVRAERASREIVQPDISPAMKEKEEREAAAKRARQAAAEREEAARAAAQRERAERALAEKEEAERQAALKERAEQEAQERSAKEVKARAEKEAQEQAEQEAIERAELEARLLKEAVEKEEREEAARLAALKAKAEKEEAEREAAEREIKERDRLQKEAAAKLRAKQEEARREAAEAEEREREEQARLEKEQAEKAKAEKEAAKAEKEAPRVPRIEAGKKEIKPQKIGPKSDHKKSAATVKPEVKEQEREPKSEAKQEVKPAAATSASSTTARLSRTPEEELAALLAEDGNEADPPEESAKAVKSVQDTRSSRSGLKAMEPTDDTPLTGMLKAIRPDVSSKILAKADLAESVEAEKSETPAEIAKDKDSEAADAETPVATAAGDKIAAVAEEKSVLPSADQVAGGADLLSSEIVGAPLSEDLTASEEPETIEEKAVEVRNVLKQEIPASVEEKSDDKLGGVDKFYKPERVKLSDFVKRSKPDDVKTKPAEPDHAKPEENAAEPAANLSADLPGDNLRAPVAAKSEASGEHSKQTKDEIRDSVKAESPEKKSALIAALKKLEEQVDDSDLDSLSTDSLKDVLSKLPDMSAASSASPANKEGTRNRMPPPAVARLASAEEQGPERDIAREKLKVMQKMTHTLPELKSYLPHKRALLVLVAVVLIGILAAVMTVRAETISARQALAKKDYAGALNSLGIALALYPFSAEAHFLRGSALYLNKNHKEAFTEYDKALKLAPDMRNALERRAAVSYQLGNYSQSVADYEKLLQQEGEQSQSFDQLQSLANAYLRVGDLQKAADMYNRCLARKSNYVPALVGKIAVSNEKKLFERAIMEAGKALAVSPANVKALSLRARAYTGLQNYALAEKDLSLALKKDAKNSDVYSARAHLRLAQKKNAEAYSDFDKALKLNPRDSGIFLDRAQAYINDNNYDLAAKDVAKARAIMDAQQTAQLYVVNSQVQIANKQAKRALEDLKEAQEKFPRNSDIILATADALAASGKLSDGIIFSEKAIEMDKSDVDAILKHGLLSIRFGNKMRAAEDFAEVIKLDPRNVVAYKTRGLMYLQQEKYASAQEDLSRVVSLDPTQTDAKAALDKAKALFARITRVRPSIYRQDGPSDAYLAGLASKDFNTLLNDGYAAYKKGDYLTAVATLEQAVKVNPRDVRARRYLAYAYKAADQIGEAASQFDALYPLGALDPQDTSSYIDMLLGSGQQEKASKVLEEAIAKSPGSQSLYLQLANTQAAQEQIPKAIQTCTKGIAINPGSVVGQKLIELRKNLMETGRPDSAPIEEPGA
ncbi:MAG: tetratricopeptide repeat protein [Candidatus Melainabacteria bacterium]|nr:tetratricopeptide repeat protein [Candidatus Melainabacteria bacterium]